ncbi:LytTR family DNA-binding domain-containing protein [Spirosoma terrae]|uniref:Response regulator transcription factor n=1 Tax=Spirosoma terrae TaxID=1968276 RepID=A0A6L9LE72_9BACT|nr:LytTR family DNA-binding domain-containing protein [Spirosoma terrae]NDU96818.1 response regulator transcription factor [Spirosoma terrae]
MNVLTYLLIDDDPFFVESLVNQLKPFSFLVSVGHCKNYGEALEAVRSKQIDFILLDVNLESSDGLSGFDFLRHQTQLPPVIIVSNTPDYAVESYSIGKAKDFLVKPIDTSRLMLAINRALNTNIETSQLVDNKSIFLKMGRRFQRFIIDDIDYFEGYGIYTKVIYKGTTHVINDTLTNLESMLDVKRFMRIHKSYIINLNKLIGFDHNKLHLQNANLPIGISYKSKLAPLLRLFDNDTLASE